MDLNKLEIGNRAAKSKKGMTSRYNLIISFFVLFILGGYSFFISSMAWYTDLGELTDATQLLDYQRWNDRNIQLIGWEYSDEHKFMEVRFFIENYAVDDRENYEFTAIEKDKGFLKCETVLEQDDYYVVRIKNIPTDWSMVVFRIGFPESYDFCKLYTNVNEISINNDITEKTLEDCFMERIDLSILEYEKDIKETQSLIAEENEIIKHYENEIIKHQEKMDYQTNKQKLDTQSAINGLNSKILEAKSKIENFENLILEYEERIRLANAQKNEYGKGE